MRDLMKMIDRVLGDNQTESLNGAYMQENVFSLWGNCALFDQNSFSINEERSKNPT